MIFGVALAAVLLFTVPYLIRQWMTGDLEGDE